MYYNIKIKAENSEFILESNDKIVTQREMDVYFAYFFDVSEEFKSKLKKVELKYDNLVSIDEIKNKQQNSDISCESGQSFCENNEKNVEINNDDPIQEAYESQSINDDKDFVQNQENFEEKDDFVTNQTENPAEEPEIVNPSEEPIQTLNFEEQIAQCSEEFLETSDEPAELHLEPVEISNFNNEIEKLEPQPLNFANETDESTDLLNLQKTEKSEVIYNKSSEDFDENSAEKTDSDVSEESSLQNEAVSKEIKFTNDSKDEKNEALTKSELVFKNETPLKEDFTKIPDESKNEDAKNTDAKNPDSAEPSQTPVFGAETKVEPPVIQNQENQEKVAQNPPKPLPEQKKTFSNNILNKIFQKPPVFDEKIIGRSKSNFEKKKPTIRKDINFDFKLFLAGFIISDLPNQFLACAFYMKNVLKQQGFTMKTINARLFKAVGQIADLSIADDFIKKGYISSTQIDDVKKYAITSLGEEYFIKKYQE